MNYNPRSLDYTPRRETSTYLYRSLYIPGKKTYASSLQLISFNPKKTTNQPNPFFFGLFNLTHSRFIPYFAEICPPFFFFPLSPLSSTLLKKQIFQFRYLVEVVRTYLTTRLRIIGLIPLPTPPSLVFFKFTSIAWSASGRTVAEEEAEGSIPIKEASTIGKRGMADHPVCVNLTPINNIIFPQFKTSHYMLIIIRVLVAFIFSVERKTLD